MWKQYFFSPTRSAYFVSGEHVVQLHAFGLHVFPSGTKRYFIHAQHRSERVWRKPRLDARRRKARR